MCCTYHLIWNSLMHSAPLLSSRRLITAPGSREFSSIQRVGAVGGTRANSATCLGLFGTLPSGLSRSLSQSIFRVFQPSGGVVRRWCSTGGGWRGVGTHSVLRSMWRSVLVLYKQRCLCVFPPPDISHTSPLNIPHFKTIPSPFQDSALPSHPPGLTGIEGTSWWLWSWTPSLV